MALDFKELEALYEDLLAKRKTIGDYEAAVREWFEDHGFGEELTPVWLDRISFLLANLDNFGLTAEESKQFDVLDTFAVASDPEPEAIPVPLAERPAEEIEVPLAAEESEEAEAADALPED